MSETDLEALVKEARGYFEGAPFIAPENGSVPILAVDFGRRLADALEASIERERKLEDTLTRIVRGEGMSNPAAVARQALDSGADH